MEFTGERYVPSQEGQIKYEHLHRYVLALNWVKGRSVLDMASGEGYGSAILAMAAIPWSGSMLTQHASRMLAIGTGTLQRDIPGRQLQGGTPAGSLG